MHELAMPCRVQARYDKADIYFTVSFYSQSLTGSIRHQIHVTGKGLGKLSFDLFWDSVCLSANRTMLNTIYPLKKQAFTAPKPPFHIIDYNKRVVYTKDAKTTNPLQKFLGKSRRILNLCEN